MTTISGRTRVFGILGDPIHQVKTPQFINPLFASQGLDAVMVPLHVEPAALATTLQALRGIRNFDGFIVTVPHKVAMVSLCDDLTPDARLVGAVNAVRRTADGRLIGTILDGDGFVHGLRAAGIEPAGLSVYLAGAGGAANAIAFAVAKAGARRLTIANRSADKAATLVNRVVAAFPALEGAVGTDDPTGHDLVINATSLGLRAGDALPLDAGRLEAGQIVAEIIMDPVVTPLLAAAAARGCRTHAGAPMLAGQIQLMAAFMTSGSVAEAPRS